MLTDSTWHVLKWMSIAVCVIYIGIQILAERRLSGDFKRRGHAILITVVVASMVQNWIEGAFENPRATRIAMVVVGIVAAVASAIVGGLLHRQSLESKSGSVARLS